MVIARITVLIILGFTLLQCKAQKLQLHEPLNKEALNVEALVQQITYYTAGTINEFVHVVKGVIILRLRNLPRERDVIYLVEKNTRTGDSSVLHGSKRYGYEKKIYRQASDLTENRAYYPSGTLKSVGYTYRKCCSPIRASYPVGKTFTYNEAGKLTGFTNHDLSLKSTYDDVVKLLKQRKAEWNNILISGSQYGNIVQWRLEYTTKQDGNCSLEINAATGEIIEDRKNLTIVY